MGYGNHDIQLWTVHEKTADNLAATGDDLILTAFTPVEVVGVVCVITTTTVSSGDIVIKVDKRPTAASDTDRGDGDIDILYIPGAIAAGKACYAFPSTPVTLNPGQQAVFQVTTAAAGGGAAGGGMYGLLVRARDEVPANITAMRDSDTAS